MAQIFISYRRDDTADAAGRIYDQLVSHFGRDNVFIDVEGLPYGVNFETNIIKTLRQCDVVLVVIGDQWLDASYEEGPKKGQRRLSDPDDYVRLEIELALAHKIPVIPVLTEKANMPRQYDLPDDLSSITLLNAAEVRSGTNFRGQVDRLIKEIIKLVPTSAPASRDSVFKNVWYREEAMTLGDLFSLRSAPEDRGTLIIRSNEIDFIGNKFRVHIKDIVGVSFGRLGTDFINQWVKVEYIEGKEKKTAMFKDGGLSGWQGILGGTKEIFDAINTLMRSSDA